MYVGHQYIYINVFVSKMTLFWYLLPTWCNLDLRFKISQSAYVNFLSLYHKTRSFPFLQPESRALSLSFFSFTHSLAIGSKTFYFGCNWLNIFWNCRRLSLSINTILSKSSHLLQKNLKKHRTRNKLSLFYIVIKYYKM